MKIIKETSNYARLSAFYEANGLEIEVSENPPEGTLKSWEYIDEETKELFAAATLQKRANCYVLADLAVREELRGSGMGKELLKIAEDEAKALGAGEMWLVGKVPAFYSKFGWTETERETAPDISRCQSCEDFGTTCFPSIMKKVFE